MRLVILDDYKLASEWAAKYICNRIIQFQPTADRYFTLGLPTGQPSISHSSISLGSLAPAASHLWKSFSNISNSYRFLNWQLSNFCFLLSRDVER